MTQQDRDRDKEDPPAGGERVAAVRILRYEGPAAWVDATLDFSIVRPGEALVLGGGESSVTELYRDWRAPTGENAGTDWVYSQLWLRFDGLLPVEIGGPLRKISIEDLRLPVCAIRECYGGPIGIVPNLGPLCEPHFEAIGAALRGGVTAL